MMSQTTENWKKMHMFLRTLLVSQALFRQSPSTVSNLLSYHSWIFLVVFPFQGAGQVSALPSISVTLSADT